MDAHVDRRGNQAPLASMLYNQGYRQGRVPVVVTGDDPGNDSLDIREETDRLVIHQDDGIVCAQTGRGCRRAGNHRGDLSGVGRFAQAIGEGEEHHCQ